MTSERSSSAAARPRAARRLSPPELAAWRGFLRTHAAMMRRLDDDLVAEHGLSLTHYDVLLQLAEAGGTRRMSDLADAVLLSRSGLTRLVDQLERQGLVSRRRCADDARGIEAVLADAGRERLRDAAGTHVRGVRRRFLDPLGPARQASLADAWDAIGGRGAGG